MDNLQFWLYVIIGLIYFISRMRKKPQNREGDAPSEEVPRTGRARRVSEQTPPPERQPTFEELLREIMEGKSEPEPEPEPVRRPDPVHQRPVYKNYDEEIEDEVSSREVVEDTDYDYRKKDSIYADYEGSKREAFVRPSLEETLKLDMTDMSYGKFKAFDTQQNQTVGNEYFAELNDPEKLKKAFVMSEILKRKF